VVPDLFGGVMLTFRLRFSRDVVLLAVGMTGCGPVLLFVVLGVMKGRVVFPNARSLAR